MTESDRSSQVHMVVSVISPIGGGGGEGGDRIKPQFLSAYGHTGQRKGGKEDEGGKREKEESTNVSIVRAERLIVEVKSERQS